MISPINFPSNKAKNYFPKKVINANQHETTDMGKYDN